MNSWRKSAAVAEAISDQRLADTLRFLLDRPADLFQTISFVVGSQQSAHSGAFRMMIEPPGHLVGVWVALEDIEPDQGPVFYLPGSHKLPYLMSDGLELPAPRRLTVADKGRAYVSRMAETVESLDADPKAGCDPQEPGGALLRAGRPLLPRGDRAVGADAWLGA